MALSKSASGYQDFPPEQIIKKKIWNFYPHHRSCVSFFSFNVQIYLTALISACDGLQRIAEHRYHVPWPHNVTVSPPPDAIIMVAISGTIIDPPDYGYRSLQVIFEAMFIFKSPFFGSTQGLNSRINTVEWVPQNLNTQNIGQLFLFCVSHLQIIHGRYCKNTKRTEDSYILSSFEYKLHNGNLSKIFYIRWKNVKYRKHVFVIWSSRILWIINLRQFWLNNDYLFMWYLFQRLNFSFYKMHCIGEIW